MLLRTKAEVENIPDLSVLAMIEKQQIGGLCFEGSERSVKANNPYLPDYNPDQDPKYIIYEDANNLYAWPLLQSLPYKK